MLRCVAECVITFILHIQSQLLRWIKEQCRGECLHALFVSVASNEDTNARLRAAVALFYVSVCVCPLRLAHSREVRCVCVQMSFDAKWIREPFLNKSGLPVILPMLK